MLQPKRKQKMILTIHIKILNNYMSFFFTMGKTVNFLISMFSNFPYTTEMKFLTFTNSCMLQKTPQKYPMNKKYLIKVFEF